MDAMNISSYEKNNIQEITQMFIITFSDSKGAKEGNNIGQLVLDLLSNTNESDFYCFIATENKKIIGSIICSRLSFETLENVFMLATVAVDTAFQRKGIGQKLIHFQINILKENGVELLITYGDPLYYNKVGFNYISEKIIKAPLKLSYPNGWLAQSLVSDEV